MRVASSRLSAFLAALLLVLLGLALWKHFRPSRFPMDVLLQDGSRLRIYDLAFRTNVFEDRPTVWQKIAASLPAKIRPARNLPPMIAFQTPSLVLVYAEERHAPKGSGNLLFRWMDDSGFENSGGASTTCYDISGVDKVIAQTFASFPRRSRNLRLRIFGWNGQPEPILLGEVSFPNQWPSQIPAWDALELPQTQTVAGLTVALTDTTFGVRHEMVRGLLILAPWTALTLKMMESNQVETNWAVVSVMTDDASGNALIPRNLDGRWKEGVYSLWFQESLWPSEPIRHKLGLVREFHFASNEVLVISDIPIPAKGAFTAVGLSTNLAGQKLRVDGLVDEGVTPPWRLDNLWTKSMSLHLTIPPMTNGVRLKLVSVVDERGRDARYPGQESFDTEYAYGVKFAEGAKTATVTLAAKRQIEVEFVVGKSKK